MTKLFSGLIFLCASVHAFELERLPTYESHRDRFNTVVSELNNYNTEKINWAVRADQNLSTQVVLAKNKKTKPERILVLSSGIHGVEAYVGSSVQIAFIKQYLKQPQEKFDFAFVHILNPWGMKNNRRVNSNNIDLNRNFLTTASDFKKKNAFYENVESFLNPNTQLQLHFAHKLLFYLDSFYYIFRYSIESLRQAILQGQYQYSRGLYYGGEKNEALKSDIDQLVNQNLNSYKEILWIDLHTGYGERGRMHLLSNESKDENAKRLQNFFPGHHIDFGQNQKFYKTTGDMISYLSNTSKSSKLTGVVIEYGTMNSQKSLGSIESLRRMIVENQAYHTNSQGDGRQQVERLLLDMFNPPELDWWLLIKSQTQELFDQILK